MNVINTNLSIDVLVLFCNINSTSQQKFYWYMPCILHIAEYDLKFYKVERNYAFRVEFELPILWFHHFSGLWWPSHPFLRRCEQFYSSEIPFLLRRWTSNHRRCCEFRKFLIYRYSIVVQCWRLKNYSCRAYQYG